MNDINAGKTATDIEVRDDKIAWIWFGPDPRFAFVNYGTNATADHGHIAIQSESSEVEFRKVDLTPISALTP